MTEWDRRVLGERDDEDEPTPRKPSPPTVPEGYDFMYLLGSRFTHAVKIVKTEALSVCGRLDRAAVWHGTGSAEERAEVEGKHLCPICFRDR